MQNEVIDAQRIMLEKNAPDKVYVWWEGGTGGGITPAKLILSITPPVKGTFTAEYIMNNIGVIETTLVKFKEPPCPVKK